MIALTGKHALYSLRLLVGEAWIVEELQVNPRVGVHVIDVLHRLRYILLLEERASFLAAFNNRVDHGSVVGKRCCEHELHAERRGYLNE